MWGNTEDLIDVFSLPLEQHSIYTRAGIKQKDYWKYYKYFIRTESYIGAFYCANFDERIRIFLLKPEDYLYDDAKCHNEAIGISQWLTPKVFKSFPKELNQLEWPKYNWTEYPFQRQRDQFGERWDEDGVWRFPDCHKPLDRDILPRYISRVVSSGPMTASLMQKRRYRVVLDLEILDDSHPADFNWENMIDIGPGECVNLVRVDEEEDDLW